MVPDDDFDRWIRWTARGEESTLFEMRKFLDANLPAGWKTLEGADLTDHGLLKCPGARWYSLSPTSTEVGVVLSIDESMKTQLRGGLVSFPVPGNAQRKPSDPVAWDQVGRFLDEGILPAARIAGATLLIPTAEEAYFSDLFFEVRNCLQTFSDAARKVLPLNLDEAEAWRRFVVAAFSTGSVIDDRWFVAWLTAQGWTAEFATELNKHFLDHCLLLSKYKDEVSAA